MLQSMLKFAATATVHVVKVNFTAEANFDFKWTQKAIMGEDNIVLKLLVDTKPSYNWLTFSLPSLEVAVRKTDNFLLKVLVRSCLKNCIQKYSQRISEQQDECSWRAGLGYIGHPFAPSSSALAYEPLK